jgi:uncharacterized membrane protein (UPF0127 family)
VKNANLVSFGAKVLALALVQLGVAGCDGGKVTEPAAANKTVFDHFTVNVGGHPASLQVAVLQQEQERGLMQRPDLGANEGMIFVNQGPRQLGIWMHNTPEPLDLAYLNPDGTIAETYSLLPLDERTVASHSLQIQYALEMPKGWFESNGIRVGASIDMAAFTAALKARGFDPVKFGIK